MRRTEIPTPLHVGGSGTPLVLLHGATSSWRCWQPVLSELEQHHRVFAPTLAGHHGGPALACAAHEVLDRLVDDLVDWLDGSGLERPHVVGNSLGGWLALELARRGRAGSVTALSPIGAWSVPQDLDRLLRQFRLAGPMVRSRLVHRLVGTTQGRRLFLGLVHHRPELVPALAARQSLQDAARCSVLPLLLEGAAQIGPIAALDDLDCPVRLAWGIKDATLPFDRFGRPMVDAVPSAELVVLPGVGHVPMYDDPALVARTVLQVTSAVDRCGVP